MTLDEMKKQVTANIEEHVKTRNPGGYSSKAVESAIIEQIAIIRYDIHTIFERMKK